MEQFRRTESAVHRTLRGLLDEDADVVVTEVVVLEVLSGARSELELHRMRRMFLAFPVLPLNGVADFETAAGLYRACKQAGESIRKLTDCLIAVPTIAAEATLLHADRDFEILARHTPLRLEPLAA